MRELKPIQGGDEPGVLILAPIDAPAEGNGTGDGDAATERFRLPVTDELRELIAAASPGGELSDAPAGAPEGAEVGAPSDGPADAAKSGDPESGAAGAGAAADETGTTGAGAAAPDATVATTSDGAAADGTGADAATADAADGSPAAAEVGATGDSAKPGAGAGAAAANVGKQGPTAVPEPDKPSEPRLILRPREIQDRVRAGASVAELVELTGMPQRRIEPFAHPVLAERARIAELGKQSRPRRSEGPAQLPLQDVLATAFAARGQDISEAEWDAWRDLSGQWIIGVTWTTGHSTTTAEYAFYAEGSATSTVARNTLAAELVDPDFARPRRSLSPVGADGEPEPRRIHPIDDADAPADAGAAPDSPAEPAVDEADEDFMRHPDDEPAPRRRRKTVMPSWEDVLLGVRPTDRK